MITPATYNTTAYCGATWDKTFTATVDGVAVNWTGYTGRMQIKEHLNSTAVLTLTSGAGITVGGSAGTVVVAMSATQTAITPGTYRYDLELTNGTTVYRLVEGKIVFDGQVTI
jgi:hypothetical protein